MTTTTPRLRLSTLLLPLLLAVAGGAQAHGDQHRATHTPVKMEQKDWGIAGDAKAATRTLTVRMGDDMRFRPDRLTVRAGETVRLLLINEGKLLHEYVLGTAQELEEHAALMLKFPNMEHDEPYMAHVPPGQRGEIVWTFNRAGEFPFACLIAGHYQAGMRGLVTVTTARKGEKP